MPFSDYLTNAIAELFRGTDITAPPAGVFLALHTADPDTEGLDNELFSGGYARTQVVFANNAGLSGNELTNSNAVVFPAGTSDLGQVNHFSLWNASVAVTCLYVGPLEGPSTWETGVSLALGVGVLKITMLNVECSP